MAPAIPAEQISGKPSRLPAGSTFELSPGVHVPHPHAEVNLPGAGDPRLGDTDAVTEYHTTEGEGDARKHVVAQKPLPDSVKPQVLTSAKDANFVQGQAAQAGNAASSSAPLKPAVDDSKANVDEHRDQQ